MQCHMIKYNDMLLTFGLLLLLGKGKPGRGEQLFHFQMWCHMIKYNDMLLTFGLLLLLNKGKPGRGEQGNSKFSVSYRQYEI